MVKRYKVLIVEEDGVDLEDATELDMNAINVFFDKTGSNILSEDTESAIKEVASAVLTSASPGFSFGRGGTLPVNSWLACEGVPSNITGRLVYIAEARVTQVFVGNENPATFSVGVYAHDGDETNLVLLGIVDVIDKRGESFTVDWPVATGKYLAVKTTLGSVKNIVAGLSLAGTAV